MMIHANGIAHTFAPRPEEVKRLTPFKFKEQYIHAPWVIEEATVYVENRMQFDALLAAWNATQPSCKYWGV